MIKLLLLQVRDEQRAFWRNRAGSLFTCVFPLVMLAIFGRSLEGIVVGDRRGFTVAGYVVPSIAAFATMSSAFFHVAGITVVHRDSGHLRRVRATPRGGWLTIAGLIGSAMVTVLIVVPCILVEGALLFGAPATANWPALVLTLVLAVPVFAAIGLALTGFLPNTVAAQAILTGIFYPLSFVSGAFLPFDDFGPLSTAVSILPSSLFVFLCVGQFDGGADNAALRTVGMVLWASSPPGWRTGGSGGSRARWMNEAVDRNMRRERRGEAHGQLRRAVRQFVVGAHCATLRGVHSISAGAPRRRLH